MTQYDRVQVKLVLIDKAQFSEALRKVWPTHFNLACKLILKPPDHIFDIICDESGVRAD